MNLSRIKLFLQLVAIAHVIGGLFLPILVNTSLFAAYNTSVYEALEVEGTGQNSNINFLHGLFGPTIASWGILFFYVVTTTFAKPDKKGWWTILLACLAWAPLDCFLSIQKGIYLNGLIDLVVFVLILGPLFMARKHFFSPQAPTP
jgi:hypothetical protein